MARDDRPDGLDPGERCEAREVTARVVAILIVDQTRQRVLDGGADGRRERGKLGVEAD